MTVPCRLLAAAIAAPLLGGAVPLPGPGTPFPPSRPASPQVAAAAKAALAKELDGASATYWQRDLAVGRKAVLVEASSGAVCGNDVGCPTVILLQSGRGWTTAWKGFAFETGGVLAATHGGLRDIALGQRQAPEVLVFDGAAYRDGHAP